MSNVLTSVDLKRRGMAAIEEALRRGPVHIFKRNKVAAVVLTEEHYQRLTGGKTVGAPGLSALQWLLAQPVAGTGSKADIDATLAADRNW